MVFQVSGWIEKTGKRGDEQELGLQHKGNERRAREREERKE